MKQELQPVRSYEKSKFAVEKEITKRTHQ